MLNEKKIKFLKKGWVSNRAKVSHESKGISNTISALKKIIVIFSSSLMFWYSVCFLKILHLSGDHKRKANKQKATD